MRPFDSVDRRETSRFKFLGIATVCAFVGFVSFFAMIDGFGAFHGNWNRAMSVSFRGIVVSVPHAWEYLVPTIIAVFLTTVAALGILIFLVVRDSKSFNARS